MTHPALQGRLRALDRDAGELASWIAGRPVAAPLARTLPFARRAARRLRSEGWTSYVLGLWLRQHFQKAGVIRVTGGWPLPQVENRGGRIEVGSCGFYSGVRLECWAGALIRIGDGTYLNRNTEIVAARSVTIGHHCMIARDVIIMDTDQHQLPDSELLIHPVELGNWIWIGARAIILKGVRIGNGAVIGAGSVVTKDVASSTVVAGVPARVGNRS